MSIWRHSDPSPLLAKQALVAQACVYCRHDLKVLPSQSGSQVTSQYTEDKAPQMLNQVAVCPKCGWWKLVRIRRFSTLNADAYAQIGLGTPNSMVYGAVGALRQLNLTSLETPIDEVRAYLVAKYEARFTMHPRLFEETVASVFADLGYHVTVTNYSGDDGIDVILHLPNGQTVGVQVKRYRNTISVEQIRALLGAMIVGDHTRGIFVTTSSFQAGAPRTVSLAASRGRPIELMDAASFYSALGIAQCASYDELVMHAKSLFHVPDGNLRVVEAP